VIEKTRPVNVIIAPDTVDRISRALSGPPEYRNARSSVSIRSSTARKPSAARNDARTTSAGVTHRLDET